MSSSLASLARLKDADFLTSVGAEEFDKCYNEAILDPASSDQDLSDIARQEELGLPFTETAGSLAFSLEDWPGPQVFDVQIVEVTGKQRQNVQYSGLLKKLYIRQNHAAQLRLVYSGSGDRKLSVSACLMFTNPDQAQHHVTACYQHSRRSDGELKDALAEFVLRMSSDSLNVKYASFKNGRKFVQIDNLPSTNQSSNQCTSVSVKFTDLSSCPGGINRRDTSLVLALTDHSGQLMGRRVLPVRICTCPKRDREKDEREERETRHRDIETHQNQGEVEEFWVLASSRDNYEALLKVGEVLEKKEGGDVDKWKEDVRNFNYSIKRRKLSKQNSD